MPHMPPMPTRPDPVRDPSRAVQWIGYHLGELAGVAVPAALAVTVSVWFALVAVLVAVGWIAHEVRVHRHRLALTATHRDAITSNRADSPIAAASGEAGARDATERRASR